MTGPRLKRLLCELVDVIVDNLEPNEEACFQVDSRRALKTKLHEIIGSAVLDASRGEEVHAGFTI